MDVLALIFCASIHNNDMCEVGRLEVDECEHALHIDAKFDDADGLQAAVTIRIKL
jgi:hypothetical protein